jgi:catechol 2,3-dioxygenase-like lactoylglutathione lyase family enzyme
MNIERLHHIAIICSNYEVSKQFYTKILVFKIENEVYRKERNSYKLDLSLNGQYLIELFSFPNPPARQTRLLFIRNSKSTILQGIQLQPCLPYAHRLFTKFYR